LVCSPTASAARAISIAGLCAAVWIGGCHLEEPAPIHEPETVSESEPEPEPEPETVHRSGPASAGSSGSEPESGTGTADADLGSCEATPELSRPKWIKHRVAPRETLHQIAHRYGVEVEDLLEWNDLPEQTERPKRNSRLKIKARRWPAPRKQIEYTVVEGDTWWRVAVKHGVDRRDLRAYNWPYGGKMKPGGKLKIWVDPVIYGWISEDPPNFELEGQTVRRGGVSIGAPDDGQLLNPVEIPQRDGWEVRFDDSSYGTSWAVHHLVAGLQEFVDNTQWKGTIRLGSMSSVVGGRIGHHKSHQSGRDIDIRLPRREGVPTGVPLTRRRIDWAVAWELIEALAHHDAVVIFLEYPEQKRVYNAAKAAGVSEERLELLQYPRGRYNRVGVVRHFPGHDHHIHVRYPCGPCEVECSASKTGTDADSDP
jgi:LysM repeat protein